LACFDRRGPCYRPYLDCDIDNAFPPPHADDSDGCRADLDLSNHHDLFREQGPEAQPAALVIVPILLGGITAALYRLTKRMPDGLAIAALLSPIIPLAWTLAVRISNTF